MTQLSNQYFTFYFQANEKKKMAINPSLIHFKIGLDSSKPGTLILILFPQNFINDSLSGELAKIRAAIVAMNNTMLADVSSFMNRFKDCFMKFIMLHFMLLTRNEMILFTLFRNLLIFSVNNLVNICTRLYY